MEPFAVIDEVVWGRGTRHQALVGVEAHGQVGRQGGDAEQGLAGQPMQGLIEHSDEGTRDVVATLWQRAPQLMTGGDARGGVVAGVLGDRQTARFVGDAQRRRLLQGTTYTYLVCTDRGGKPRSKPPQAGGPTSRSTVLTAESTSMVAATAAARSNLDRAQHEAERPEQR